ncbi:MAG: ester cyclase [Paracoccaceae bacterium]
MSEEAKRVVREWFAAFPDLDDAIFERLVHPDIVNHPAPPGLREGRGNFERVIRYVLAAAPDQTYACDALVAEGAVVVARTRWAGRFTGEYLGVRGNGGRFEVGQYHAFRLDGGRLAEHWAVRDDLEVFRQTGVAPPGPHG